MKMNIKKLYVIEEKDRDYYGAQEYRFCSLYNGMRGTWHYKKELATEEGDKHTKIINQYS